MNTPPPGPAADDVRITWRVVLGLSDPAAAGWSRVRAAQLGELARLLPVIAFANLVNALALATMMWSAAPHRAVLLWTATMVAATAACLALRARAAHAAAAPGRHALPRATVGAATFALLWMVPPALLATHGAVDQQLAICMVVASMMGSATLTCASVPAAMAAFVALAGCGLAVMMAPAGGPVLTLLPLLYALSLIAGGAEAARSFVRRRWAELVLEEKQEVVKLLLREFEDQESDWLWEVDTAKLLRRVSGRLARTVGQTPDTLEGVSLLRLLAGERWETGPIAPELSRLVELMNARESFAAFHLPVTIDGQAHWWSLSAAPRFDERGGFAGYRGVGSDITEQRRSTASIEHAARFDALTGLSNRAQFMDATRKAIGRAHRDGGQTALLLVDLDKFKPVNDTLGHPIGDRVLKLAAERMRARIAKDDIAGRLGGDEFAVLVQSGGEQGRVEALALALIAALSTPFEIDGHLIRIGASIGSAAAPRDGRTVETLVRNADLALYRAKHDGRGRHCRFAPSLLAEADRRRAIESALREALDHGQFHLVYQPVVDGEESRIEGFEALVRWTHPTLGAVPPADFLPIAEEARLTARIGEWVLRTACHEAAAWPAPLRIAVNLSVEQLTDRQLPATVLAALAQAGLAPERLELDVSENAFLRENPSVTAALDQLQAIGVRVALDDFGTGYAALGYVRGGRFDAIKIDQSFVRGAARNEVESLAVVRAVVAMAGSLGIPTIAEGLESEHEYLRMRELGCRHLQGHLSGAPMRADAVRALIAARAPDGARVVA